MTKRGLIILIIVGILFFQPTSSQVDNVYTDAQIKIEVSSEVYDIGEDVFLADGENSYVKSEKNGSIVVENIQIDQSFKENIFIVELKEEPIIEFKSNIEDGISRREEKLRNSEDLYKYTIGLVDRLSIAYSRARIDSDVKKQREEIEKEHDKVKEQIRESVKIPIVGEYEYTLNGILIKAEKEDFEKLPIGEIKKIHLNTKVSINLQESAPLVRADKVWSLDRNGNECNESGNECLTGKGIKISIIDTGVDYAHADLGGCFGNGCKVENGYDFVNDDIDPMDDHGHGTHVAGIAGGKGTLKGMAPDSIIYAYKALDNSGGGYASDIISAIERSVDPNSDGDFSDHVDIISMSLGGPGDPDSALSKSVDNAVRNGVVVVVSAGNSGPSERTIGTPGTARKAITVGAVDKSKNLAAFSSRGPVRWINGTIIKPDILAPGVYICSAQHGSYSNNSLCVDDEHIQISGTSMSAPHISGIAALVLQKNPSWTPEQVKHALRSTAVGRQPDINTYGYGIVDALNAVFLTSPPPVVKVQTNDKIAGILDLKGEIISDNFERYEVYLVGDSGLSAKLFDSTTLPKGEVLFSEFNSRNYVDGTYLIKVIVYNSDGVSSEDNSMIFIDNIGFISPKSYQYLNKLPGKNIEIKSGITDETVRDYSIDYALSGEQWRNKGIIIPQYIENEVIAFWNISELDIGLYDLRLTATLTSGSIEEEIIKVVLVNGDLTPLGNFDMKSPVISDLDNDGDNEIIASVKGAIDLGGGFIASGKGRIFILDENTDIVKNWEIPSVRSIDFLPSPTIADINNDSIKEIILGEESGHVHVWNPRGEYLEGWPKKTGGIISKWSPVSVYDINNDGNVEIIVAESTKDVLLAKGKVHIFDNKGNFLPGWPRNTNVNHLSSPSAGDIDGDGDNEIVVTGGNGFLSGVGAIYIWDSEGNLLPGWPVSLNSNIVSSPILADIDNDSKLEIIFGDYDGRIHAFNHDGTELGDWPVSLGKGGVLTASPAIGNLDDDLDLEIAIHTCSEQKVYVFNKNGELLPGWPQFLGGTCIDSLTLGDVDSDGNVDIIGQAIPSPSGSEQEGKVIAWNNDGSIIDGFPITFGNAYPSSSVISDLDKDGKTDLIMALLNNDNLISFLYRIELNSVFDTSKSYWPMFKHNVQHTGLYSPPKPNLCGNGEINEGEECDDGNSSSNDECSVQCRLTFCGDGFVQSPNGNGIAEDCDDGNNLDGDNCPASCILDEDRDGVDYKNDCNDFDNIIGKCTGCAVCSEDPSFPNSNGTCVASGINTCGVIHCPGLSVCGGGDCGEGELATFDEYQRGSCIVSGNNGVCSEPKCVANSCIANEGCLMDGDGDGIPDAQDRCPNDNFGGSDKQNIFGLPMPNLSSLKLDIETNISRENLESMQNFTFSKSDIGKIRFPPGSLIPLVRKVNETCVPLEFEDFIRIDPRIIELKSDGLPELNAPAQLTFESISYTNPQVLRDGSPCQECTIVSYNNGELVVDVPGFSIYTIIEGDDSGGSSGGGGSGGGSSGGGSFGGGSGSSSRTSTTPVPEEYEEEIPEVEKDILEIDKVQEEEKNTTEPIIEELPEEKIEKSNTKRNIIFTILIVIFILVVFIFSKRKEKGKRKKIKTGSMLILLGFFGLLMLFSINFPLTGSIIQEISCEDCESILPLSYVYNKGPYNLTGYSIIKVQLSENGEWKNIRTVFRDKEVRTISPSSFINLNGAWKEGGGFTPEFEGRFRLYAEFSYNNGSVVDSINGPLVDFSEFEVTDSTELPEDELSEINETNVSIPYEECENCIENNTLQNQPDNVTLEKPPANDTQEEEPVTGECTDTDNGRDYNVKGTAGNTAKNQNGNDYCVSSYPSTYNLIEYYCNPDGEFQSESYLCENGCSNGACVGGGEPVYSVVAAPYDCTDTDGTENYGKIYDVAGSATSKGGVGGSDYCVEGNNNFNLIEYFCPDQSQAQRIGYNCPNGCQDGACI